MSYAVKTIYYTIQGEGMQAGRPAVFLRFSGCNLWSGREEGRARAICQFCDTDFLGVDGPGGGHFSTADALANAVAGAWPVGVPGPRLVVCTGGEPLLQVNERLVDALHVAGFEVAVETNGTRQAPRGIDWLTVSPKLGSDLVLRSGSELKLVYPQAGGEPEKFAHLDFGHFLLQPMDGPEVDRNTRLAAEYARRDPRWRLSIQLHKLLGLA